MSCKAMVVPVEVLKCLETRSKRTMGGASVDGFFASSDNGRLPDGIGIELSGGFLHQTGTLQQASRFIPLFGHITQDIFFTVRQPQLTVAFQVTQRNIFFFNTWNIKTTRNRAN